MQNSYVLLLILGLSTAGAANAQGTDIYLFDMQADFGLFAQVTDRDGYDSQPAFSPDGKALMFSSDRAGDQVDIFQYLITDKTTRNLTDTADMNEYSAQPWGPDEFTFVLQEGSPYQNLWRKPLIGGSMQRMLTSYVPVGYYARNEKGVLFWGRYAYALFFEPAGADIGPGNGESLYVIDQAGRSIHAIPGSDKFSFVHKQSDWTWVIKSFDPDSKAIAPITPISNENEDYCWTPTGTILMAEGTVMRTFTPGPESTWQKLAELRAPGLHKGGRCAVSPDGRFLALVNERIH